MFSQKNAGASNSMQLACILRTLGGHGHRGTFHRRIFHSIIHGQKGSYFVVVVVCNMKMIVQQISKSYQCHFCFKFVASVNCMAKPSIAAVVKCCICKVNSAGC